MSFFSAKYYKVPTSNVYLVHDELSKSVGKTSLKTAGSAGYVTES